MESFINKISLILLMTAMAAGCGGGGGDSVPVTDPVIFYPDFTITGASGNQVSLDGQWSAGCKLDEDGDMGEDVTTISGPGVSISGKSWSGVGDCSGSPDMTFRFIGSFTSGDEVTVQLNSSPVTATKIDIAVSLALFTVYDADWVAYFNTNATCGATDWVIAIPKGVVGTDCMPASFKDVMYIDDTVDPDLMYEGLEEEKGGTLDANGYPTVLDADTAEARLSGITVSGSVTLPDSVTDKDWFVGIDNDFDGDNGTIASATGVVTGSTFYYSLDNAPSGDYYIYGGVSLTENLGFPTRGDYVGSGCGTVENYCKVTIDSPKTVDFTLDVMPEIKLLLDGVGDRAEATTSIFPDTDTAQSFTVETWIYPAYDTYPASAFLRYIADDDAYSLMLAYVPGGDNNGVGIYFALRSDCSTLVEAVEFRDVTLNQWNHVVAMFDASAQHFTISINGILSSSPVSYTAGTFCSALSHHFTVGGFYGTNDDTFQGSIDEVRVSDNVRYNTNFTPLYSFIPDANTKGLWHFDESPGSTSFSDSSGNGNTLTGLNGAHTN